MIMIQLHSVSRHQRPTDLYRFIHVQCFKFKVESGPCEIMPGVKISDFPGSGARK